jgi:hypothetical protein
MYYITCNIFALFQFYAKEGMWMREKAPQNEKRPPLGSLSLSIIVMGEIRIQCPLKIEQRKNCE